MPQRIGPAGTVRVAITGGIGGQNVVNVFWATLTTSATVTQADLDTWTDAFGAAFKARFTSSISAKYAFSGIQSTYFVDGTATNVLQSTRTMTGSATGSGTEDAGLAMIISWLSSAYWRGGKPRTYLAGAGGNLNTTVRNQWTSAYVTVVQTAATAFLSDINALTGGTTITGTKLGFVSFQSGNTDRVPPLFYAFTGFKLHPRTGEQRRRRGKWLA
jgi:hypothetical protein